ncbi:MAG: MFS transporter [Armatimonadota bacterium]|jgi:MFS family permease
MAVGEPTPELARLDILRGMRLWNIRSAFAGVFWSITLGAYRTGYALHLGASDALIGILAGVESWVHTLQMVSPLLIERVRRRKALCILAFGGSYVIWLPIALIPFFVSEAARPWAMIALVGLSSAMLASASPALSSWFTDLVPAQMRGRYVARQHTVIGGVGLVASIAAGRYMDIFPDAGRQTGFISLFAVAVGFSLVSVGVWSLIPEPPMARGRPVRVGAFLSLPFRHASFRSLMIFGSALALALMIAGPFFVVYMLKQLQIPYAQIAIFSAINTICAMITNPMWGYLSDKFGHKPMLKISAGGICLIPLAWFFVTKQNYWVTLPIIQVWAGTIGAGLVLSQYNLMLKTAPAESRTVYIGAYSALVSGASAVGAMLGGALADVFSRLAPLTWLGQPVSNMQCVFLVSSACRVASLGLLARVGEERETTPGAVLSQIRSGRPLLTLWGLLRMARSADPTHKAHAAEALGSTRSMLAVDDLIRLLDDTDRDVRRQAAKALGQIGDARAVQPLIEKSRDPLADIVEDAVEALGHVRAPGSLEALLQLLNDERASVRKSAALALATMGAPEAQEPLERMIVRERDTAVFLVAADALSKVGSRQAMHVLRRLLRRSSSGVVRRQAANAMGNLLGQRGQFYAILQADEMRQEELVARILNRARRRLRGRVPAPPEERGRVQRQLEVVLRQWTEEQYANAVRGAYDIASRIARQFAQSALAENLLASEHGGHVRDMSAERRVGLLLKSSDGLQLNMGFVSGLYHEVQHRRIHREEALLAMFAFGQIADELRRLARDAGAARGGGDRYRGDSGESV